MKTTPNEKAQPPGPLVAGAGALNFQEHFPRIAATVPGIIHALRLRPDGSSCFVYAHQRIEDIYGVSLEELSRDASAARERIHPEDWPWVMETIEQSRRAMAPWRHEFRVCHPTRGVLWVEVHSMPEAEPDGSTLWHGFMQDITQRKAAEAKLAKTNRQLVEASRLSGMAEMATGVLHNVGNVLNSLNISATLVSDQVKESRAVNIARVAGLLREHAQDLGDFITKDPKGRILPEYLDQLAGHLTQEHQSLLKELESLKMGIEHIKEMIVLQQTYARTGGVTQRVNMAELVEDALRLDADSLTHHKIQVCREFAPHVPELITDKNKALQILLNLIRNAKCACGEASVEKKRITLRLNNGGEYLSLAVADNGVGIAPENLPRLFQYGFTTRKGGHGFGLHSSLLAAQDLGGALIAQSDGVGKGATFTLKLPVHPKLKKDSVGETASISR